MVPFHKRTLRTMLAALGLSVAVAAVPAVASASIALGTVVSANPANFTPNVASGAVHKFVQVGGTMYAGGAFSSVSTPAGVSPGGTFARGNIVAFNAATGVISSFAPSVNGEVWALASNGTSLWIGGTFTSVNGVARRGVAKLNPATGAVDPAFNANLASGKVTELALAGGRLIAGGTFPGKLRAVNPATGANTGYLNLSISGSVTANAGPVEVYRFAVNPAGTRLVAVGNFTSVGG
ncbi:MAG TPA: hypothetical protein VFS70_13235, partial [Actinomycetota bacterium]|nr:hypothetical protein [Actinomycetota bacterium]